MKTLAKILYRSWVLGCLYASSCGMLLRRFNLKIFKHPLTTQSDALCGPSTTILGKILERPLREDLVEMLVKFSERSFHEYV